MYRTARGDYLAARGRGARGSFFGGIIHAVGGVVGGAVGGLIKGGPLGAITGAVGGAISATRSNSNTAVLEAGGSGTAYTPAVRAAHNAVLARSHATAPIGGSTMGTPHGMHITAGSTRGGGGGGGRRRRMRVTNVKALKRAERRVAGFVHLYRKCVRVVHPEKKGTIHARFPKRRK